MDKIVFDDGEINGKPAPDMFLKAARKINQNPSDCIVFEDSVSGIAAAKSADIGKIIIVDPVGQKSKYSSSPDVDLVISDFRKINKSVFH